MSSTYADWVTWLEAFRRGENPPTDRLGPIENALGSYMQARLEDRLSLAVSDRIRQWQSLLADRIVARPPQTAADASVLFREASERLEPLQRLASSPLLPRSLSVSMHRTLGGVRDGAHAALDDAWRRAQAEAQEEALAVPRLRPPQRAMPHRSALGQAAAVPAPRGGVVRGVPAVPAAPTVPAVPARRAAPEAAPRV